MTKDRECRLRLEATFREENGKQISGALVYDVNGTPLELMQMILGAMYAQREFEAIIKSAAVAFAAGLGRPDKTT